MPAEMALKEFAGFLPDRAPYLTHVCPVYGPLPNASILLLLVFMLTACRQHILEVMTLQRTHLRGAGLPASASHLLHSLARSHKQVCG
jgi:hypothetical protein